MTRKHKSEKILNILNDKKVRLIINNITTKKAYLKIFLLNTLRIQKIPVIFVPIKRTFFGHQQNHHLSHCI